MAPGSWSKLDCLLQIHCLVSIIEVGLKHPELLVSDDLAVALLCLDSPFACEPALNLLSVGGLHRVGAAPLTMGGAGSDGARCLASRASLQVRMLLRMFDYHNPVDGSTPIHRGRRLEIRALPPSP